MHTSQWAISAVAQASSQHMWLVYPNCINVWFPQNVIHPQLNVFCVNENVPPEAARAEQRDAPAGKSAGKMIQGQKRAEETTRTHTLPFYLTHMRVFGLECKKLYTDKVSSGLFLTQINSKSTRALGCFLRMLVAVAAYKFLSSIFWQHLSYREWEPAETISSSEKQPCLIFFFHKPTNKIEVLRLFVTNCRVHFNNVIPGFSWKAFV